MNWLSFNRWRLFYLPDCREGSFVIADAGSFLGGVTFLAIDGCVVEHILRPWALFTMASS
jgi:hypothetical protein